MEGRRPGDRPPRRFRRAPVARQRLRRDGRRAAAAGPQRMSAAGGDSRRVPRREGLRALRLCCAREPRPRPAAAHRRRDLHPARQPARQGRLLGLTRRLPTAPVVLAGSAAFLNLYATQPLLPLLSRSFGATAFDVGLTITAPTVAIAITAPLIGRLADRI